jgi:hypothetical protein
LAEVYRDRLAGAVIIDPSNPFVRYDDGVMTIKHVGGKTSGMVTAELLPKSSVARAFSDQLAETLWLVIRPLLETPVTERTPLSRPEVTAPCGESRPTGGKVHREAAEGRPNGLPLRVNVSTS